MHSVAKTTGSDALYPGIRTQREMVMECLAAERYKLENLIIEVHNRGRENLGADLRILEQSRKLDQLVVDEMMLEEMLKAFD